MPSQPVRIYQGDSSWESFAHGNGGNCHAVSFIPFLGLFFVCLVFCLFSFFSTLLVYVRIQLGKHEIHLYKENRVLTARVLAQLEAHSSSVLLFVHKDHKGY